MSVIATCLCLCVCLSVCVCVCVRVCVCVQGACCCCSGRGVCRSRDVIVDVITVVISCHSNANTDRWGHDAVICLLAINGTAILSQCHTVTVSVTLSQCHIVTLSQCHTVTLPYCHTLTLSHYHTICFCAVDKPCTVDFLIENITHSLLLLLSDVTMFASKSSNLFGKISKLRQWRHVCVKVQLQRKFFYISISELWLYRITIYAVSCLSKIK